MTDRGFNLVSPHFSVEELECKCGCGRCGMDRDFMAKLEMARTLYGRPIRVTSGFRCLAHNEAIKGAKASYHMWGKAADLYVGTSQDRFDLMIALYSAGFRRFGLSPKGFIHVDSGTEPIERGIWIYGS